MAFNSDGEFTAGKGAASYSIPLKRAWATGGHAQPPTTQINGELKGKIAMDSNTLNLDSNLADSSLGSFQASLRYALDSGPLSVTLPQLLAVLTKGTPIELPDGSLKVNGKLDLVAIGQAVPAVLQSLNFRPDVRFTAGSLALNDIQVSGGAKPAASGSLNLSLTSERIGPDGTEKLAAGLAPPASRQQAGRLNAMQPIIIALKVNTGANGKMNVEQAELSSSFGDVDVKGELPTYAGKFHFDLDKAHAEFNEFLNLDNVVMTGTLDNGTITAAPNKDNSQKIDFGLDVAANNLAFGTVSAPAATQRVAMARPAAKDAYPGRAAPYIRLIAFPSASPSARPPRPRL